MPPRTRTATSAETAPTHPTVDDILEATAESAIRFTRADRGHAYLVARDEGQDVVTHQCLVWKDGTIVRQYDRRRRLLHGPCQEAVREGRMYYVHDAATNRLHRELLRELAAREKALKGGDRLKREYVRQYRAFLEPARSYIAVPIKRPGGASVGCLALYSTEREDFFGVLKKRIIEEYLDDFAGALIVALIDKARGVPEVAAPPRIFDENAEASPWDGTGPYLERILRHGLRHGSWNRAAREIERFLMELALQRSAGHPTQALKLLRMPRRTFFAKLKKHGLTPGKEQP
jgi:hypothetical protein